MSETEKRSFLRIRNITAFSILIMLIFAWIVVDQVTKSAHVARDDAVTTELRLLHVISQRIELTFTVTRYVLNSAAEHQYYKNLYQNNSPDEVLKDMQRLINSLPCLSTMLYIDEQGQAIVATHKKGYEHWVDYGHYPFVNEELFTSLKNGKEYYMGKLRSDENNPSGMIIMAKRLKNQDGQFGGVLLATVDPNFFEKYFQSIEPGRHSYASLRLLDSGISLLDTFVQGEDYTAINNLALEEYKLHNTGDIPVVSTYKTDKDKRIYGSIKLKDIPILLVIALSETDYMKEWHDTRFKDFFFLTIFIVFGSLLSFFAIAMARQVVRVEKSEAAAVLASQAKSEFLANMSHELRTPLNAIIGFSEMMNSGYFGQLNAKQKERIHDINLCGSHLLNLITDILEFSKGDAGKLELVEEKVVMQDIVNECLRIMNKKIKEKQMNMLIEIDDTVPAILGDKRKIRQILLNLLSNSVKFTPENGTIKVAVRQDASQNVTMTVSDTGIGIAEKDIPVALSVFGQVHRSQSHEGTGLGLPLCKMFAELHGGRLAFGSTLGEGTTVRITFPASRNIA